MTPADWRNAVMALVFGMNAAAVLLATLIEGCFGRWPASVAQTSIGAGLFIMYSILAARRGYLIGIRERDVSG